MQTKRIKKLQEQLIGLKVPTKICKICFNPIKTGNLMDIFTKNDKYCINCLNKLRPVFKKFTIKGVSALCIYYYDDYIKEMLYQLKGCYDIEIADLFLYRYKNELSMRFHNYVLVPIPSSKEDDIKRGFNHVVKIYESLNLKYENVFYKSSYYKQSDQKKKDRKQIKNILKMSNVENLKNKNILLVDDVCTTGETLSAAVDLVRSINPKRINILLVAKVKQK